MFVSNCPVSIDRMATLLPEWNATDIATALKALQCRYEVQRRPYRISVEGGEWQTRLTAEYREPLLATLRAERGFKLNRVLLEVLSLIAYRQPISKSELEDQLGIEVDSAIRMLLRRRLIASQPAEAAAVNAVPGPPTFKTTTRFLEVFQLDSLSDLPAFQDSL